MKHNDISYLSTLSNTRFENIFNVYINKAGYPYYNLGNVIKLPNDLNDEVYTSIIVEGNSSWQTISYNNYGTVDLWWLVLAANNINNPIMPPSIGSVLRIIKPSYVSDILQNITNQT